MSAVNAVPRSERPEPLLEGLLRVGPRLVERSRRQAEFAAVVVQGLRRLSSSHSFPDRTSPVEATPPLRERHEPTVLDRVGSSPDVPVVSPTTGASPALTGPPEQELPIDGYDSLAASQVVPRLVTLSPDELRSVQRYEQAGRHRQTILNRVEQLLAGP